MSAATWAPTSCPTLPTRCKSGGCHHGSTPTLPSFLFPFVSNVFPLCSFLSLRCTGCEAVLCGIEEQVSRANQYRESQLKVKIQVETEVSGFSTTSGKTKSCLDLTSLYCLASRAGLQPAEDAKGQCRLAIVWPRPCRRSVQPGCGSAGGAAGPSLLSGTTATRQKELQGERVS